MSLLTVTRQPEPRHDNTRQPSRRSLFLIAQGAVFAAAVVARVVPVARSGGFHGNYGYDASVYYAAADGLVHGQMPYRDYLLLHPPVSVLLLAPFAWVGSLTTAGTGFLLANLFMTVLSAVNAVLVVRVCRRFGLGPAPALAGGVFYALWWCVVRTEYLVRLETAGNFFLLAALLAFAGALERRAPWRFAVVGVFLTLAVSTKIWFAAPAVLVVVWQLAATRSARFTAWVLGGAAGAAVLVDGPFFIAAPRRMAYMVVKAQLGRRRTVGAWQRLKDATAFGQAFPASSTGTVVLVAVIVAVAVLGACLLVCTVRTARWFVALLAVHAVVAVISPSWFLYYADFLAVPAALCVAAFAAALARSRWGSLGAWLPVVLAAAQTLIIIGDRSPQLVAPFPDGPALASAAHNVACIKSDSPMALIELDALDRSFAAGCQDWVDVLARTFGAGKKADRLVHGQPNPTWNADLSRYLTTGGGVMLVRPGFVIGLPTIDEQAISRFPVVASNGVYTLYRIPGQ